MIVHRSIKLSISLSILLIGAASCGHDHPHDVPPPVVEEETSALPPGVIAIPESVQANLGITFAAVELRRVQDTVRLPGHFELMNEATAEYRAAGRGRVEFLVQQYQQVEKGTPLVRLSTPEWISLLLEIREAEEDATLVIRQREAQQVAIAATEQSAVLWEERVAKLEKLTAEGGSQASQLTAARSELVKARTDHALAMARMREVEHLVHAILDEATGRNPRFESAIAAAALFIGVEESWLLETVDGSPRWHALRDFEIVARQAGIVDKVAVPGGGLVEDGGLILSTIDPAHVRFRGFALQSQLTAIAFDQQVAIVPPHGGISSYSEPITATLRQGTEADPLERTFDVLAMPTEGSLPGWARPGVSAFVEVTVAGSADEEFAIPLSAVIQDGVDRIFFLRNRNQPDQVVRMVADLGADDGRWVVVHSGVRPGDQVVLEGVYELKLIGGGAKADEKGGHFHSDGSFHQGEH